MLNINSKPTKILKKLWRPWMLGIIIIAHGQLANELLLVLNSIAGPQKNIEAVCIHNAENIDEMRKNLFETIDKVNQNKGVVIVTDMFGGTPSNLALSTIGLKPVEVIAGANLPMLLKLIKIRSTADLHTAVEMAQEYGRKYILTASEFLGSTKIPTAANA